MASNLSAELIKSFMADHGIDIPYTKLKEIDEWDAINIIYALEKGEVAFPKGQLKVLGIL